MPSARPSGPDRLPRRAILRTLGAGGALAALAGVTGCRLRLESEVPPPAVRQPVPDEAALLRVLTVTAFLGLLAAQVRPSSAVATRLGSAHREQVAVVRDRLRTAGVPDTVTRAAATPLLPSTASTSPTSGTSAAPAVTATALATAEGIALTSDLLAVLPHLTAVDRPLVAAVAACSAAGAAELGRPVTWPRADPLPAPAAATLLDPSRAAAYGLEVAAARVEGTDRAAVVAALTVVRSRVTALSTAAGASARPEPLGYPLPSAVGSTDPRRLVEHVLSGLVARGLDPLRASTVAPGSSATTTLVRLQADAVGLARTWGVAPTAFPGMVAA